MSPKNDNQNKDNIYKIGDIIEHFYFGVGEILEIINNSICRVKFNNHGIKDIYPDFNVHKINIQSKNKNNNVNKKVDYYENEENEKNIIQLKCLLCGNIVDYEDKHFCLSCYNKYKNKELIIKLSNKFNDIQILENEYKEPTLLCNDHHKVRSKSEKMIDDWLFDNRFSHIYEPELLLNEDKSIKPDFKIFLPNNKILYLEHLGYGENNLEYQEQIVYKNKIYQKNNLDVIYTTEKDMENLDKALSTKFKIFLKN